jgi:hypothetical protein
MRSRKAITHLQGAMFKQEVLALFYRSLRPLTPDEINGQLVKCRHRTSVYSYLFRLHQQGLLKRGTIAGRIVYSISARGVERLRYLNSVEEGT